MKNEFGEALDRNGYAPSLLDTARGVCWYCGTEGGTARHEIFEGRGRRRKSKALGLWVNVCPVCHALCHEHPQSGVALLLKQAGQRAAMEAYGWDAPRFIRELGKNYITEDEQC